MASICHRKELATGYRTHTCNELRMAHVGAEVSLVGWVQQSRDMKHFAFVDLRDRYGITQVVFDNPGAGGDAAALATYEAARALGREYVVRCKGVVVERASKNAQRACNRRRRGEGERARGAQREQDAALPHPEGHGRARGAPDAVPLPRHRREPIRTRCCSATR